MALISRQAAIDVLKRISFLHFGIEIINSSNALEEIEALPTAQPEVIRCKDCGHLDEAWTSGWAKGYHYCPMIEGICDVDFFCADAERRTDD